MVSRLENLKSNLQWYARQDSEPNSRTRRGGEEPPKNTHAFVQQESDSLLAGLDYVVQANLLLVQNHAMSF